jgi:DNA-directed RNA polymerase specialized sigma24 family protein
MSEGESITELFIRLRSGDDEAAEGIWNHYCPRLIQLARQILGGRRPGVLDPIDAAHSAFASFLLRTKSGSFAHDLGRNELWKLLATITIRKARRHLSRELSQKRGGGAVLNECDFGEDFSPLQLLESVPMRDFDQSAEDLLNKLDNDEQRTIAIMRFMNYTNREIAENLRCTERKIERKLNLIRRIWNEEFEDR